MKSCTEFTFTHQLTLIFLEHWYPLKVKYIHIRNQVLIANIYLKLLTYLLTTQVLACLRLGSMYASSSIFFAWSKWFLKFCFLNVGIPSWQKLCLFYKIKGAWKSVTSKSCSTRFFGVVNFLQKTDENKSTIIVVKSNSLVRFLEEIDDPKNHFEINWPLQELFFLKNQVTFWQSQMIWKIQIQSYVSPLFQKIYKWFHEMCLNFGGSNQFQLKSNQQRDITWNWK